MSWFPGRRSNPHREVNFAIDEQMKRSTYVTHWRCGLHHVLLRRKKGGFEVVYYSAGRFMRSQWAEKGEEQASFEEMKGHVATAIAKVAMGIT